MAPEKAQTVIPFNTKSITDFQYGTPWSKILWSRGSRLEVCLFTVSMGRKGSQTHHIIHCKCSHGNVVDSAAQQQKHWRDKEMVQQQQSMESTNSSMDEPGDWPRLSPGKCKKSPRGNPDSDRLSVKIKQNDRKQLTDTHFSRYPPQENVKCHHLREWIFVCDLKRISVFTCI